MDPIRELLREAKRLGFRVERSHTRHTRWQLTHPVTRRVVRLPRQARARGPANYRAQLRRAAKEVS